MPTGYLARRLAFGVRRSARRAGEGRAWYQACAALLTDGTNGTHETNVTGPPISPMSRIGPFC
jgi:hypothetical protein